MHVRGLIYNACSWKFLNGRKLNKGVNLDTTSKIFKLVSCDRLYGDNGFALGADRY